MIETEPPPSRGSARIRAAAGVVLFAYAVTWALALSVVAASRTVFADVQRAAGSLAGRIALAVVVVAALLHALDGVASMVAGRSDPDPDPGGGARRDRPIPPAVGFLVLAVGLPAALVVLWPSVKGLFA